MKKLLLLILTFTLSVSLVACDKAKEDIYEFKNEELTIEQLFTEVKENVQPGTAGCSLKAIIVAIDFLNFYDSNLDFEKTISTFETKYSELTDEEKADFDEAWSMVYSEVTSMLFLDETSVKEKLDLSGCMDKNNYPWQADSKALYDAFDGIVAK